MSVETLFIKANKSIKLKTDLKIKAKYSSTIECKEISCIISIQYNAMQHSENELLMNNCYGLNLKCPHAFML